MDKKISVTATKNSIVLRSETKVYEGTRDSKGNIIVTTTEVPDEKKAKSRKWFNNSLRAVIYSLVLTIIVLIIFAIRMNEYVPATVQEMIYAYFIVFISVFFVGTFVLSLLEAILHFIFMKMYSQTRKSKIAAAYKLHILLNRIIVSNNYYKFDCTRFIEQFKGTKILRKDIEASKSIEKVRNTLIWLYWLVFAVLGQRIYVSAFVTQDFNTFISSLFLIILMLIILVISTLPGIVHQTEKHIKGLELKCSILDKPYYNHIILATTVAKKFFETEYPKVIPED